MSSSAWAVQVAVFERLSNVLAVPIFDAPASAEADPPYVTIDSVTVSDWSTLTRLGESLTVTISSWSVYGGKKEVAGLMAQIKEALHAQPLSAAGFGVVQVREEFAEIFVDADGVTQHGVQRFRVIVQRQV